MPIICICNAPHLHGETKTGRDLWAPTSIFKLSLGGVKCCNKLFKNFGQAQIFLQLFAIMMTVHVDFEYKRKLGLSEILVNIYMFD
jgi:hypothetical protein